MSSFLTIRFDAGNNNLGNPRRIFVTFQNGNIVAAYDEGYEGEKAISNRYHRKAYNGYTFSVTVAQYDELVKRNFS